MQPSAAAMQQSCTGGQGNCLFSVSKEEEEDMEVKESKDEQEVEEEEGI